MSDRVLTCHVKVAYFQHNFYNGKDEAKLQTIPENMSATEIQSGFWVGKDGGIIHIIPHDADLKNVLDAENRDTYEWIPPSNIRGIQRMWYLS